MLKASNQYCIESLPVSQRLFPTRLFNVGANVCMCLCTCLMGMVGRFKPNGPVHHAPPTSRTPLDAKGSLGSLQDNTGLVQLWIPTKPGFKF